jgi:hypothetical protein
MPLDIFLDAVVKWNFLWKFFGVVSDKQNCLEIENIYFFPVICNSRSFFIK